MKCGWICESMMEIRLSFSSASTIFFSASSRLLCSSSSFAFTAALMFLFAGCSAKVVIPEEVLQLPEHSEVYTACNLWYNDGEKADNAAEIDELNIMKGKILPFGTRIEFLPSDENGIAFKTVNGNKVFRFRYEQARNVEPVETVIRKFFTTKTSLFLWSNINP